MSRYRLERSSGLPENWHTHNDPFANLVLAIQEYKSVWRHLQINNPYGVPSHRIIDIATGTVLVTDDELRRFAEHDAKTEPKEEHILTPDDTGYFKGA